MRALKNAAPGNAWNGNAENDNANPNDANNANENRGVRLAKLSLDVQTFEPGTKHAPCFKSLFLDLEK